MKDLSENTLLKNLPPGVRDSIARACKGRKGNTFQLEVLFTIVYFFGRMEGQQKELERELEQLEQPYLITCPNCRANFRL